MQPTEPITLTCARCRHLYHCTVAEAADYLDAFPANEATPCCDDEGWFLESELISYLMENHVPMCPRCAQQLARDEQDSVELSLEFVYCPQCNFKEVIEFVRLKLPGEKDAGNAGERPAKR